MPLKNSLKKTTQFGDGVPGQSEPEAIEQGQGKIVDPENLKMELRQQNDAFIKILARLEPKKKP